MTKTNPLTLRVYKTKFDNKTMILSMEQTRMMNFQINDRVRIETKFYGKYHGKMGTVIGLNCVN